MNDHLTKNLHIKHPTADLVKHTVKYTSLRQAVAETVKKYYEQVEVKYTTDVYEMVLSEIEEPLLQETIKFCKGNQSRAAIVLGLSRGTLRKILKKHGLDK